MLPRPAAALAGAILATAAALVAHADGPAPPGRIVAVDHTPLADAPTRGRHDAPVTIEVFFSAGSELGNQAYRRAMAFWRRHPGRVRLVFRPIKRSEVSEFVAPIAIAAHAHGRFFELMDALVNRTGPLASQETVIELAVRAGLDRAAATGAVTDNHDIKDVLDANHRRSVRARVGQRNDLVLNGRPLGPTPDDATLEAAYRAALALARVELAAGAPARVVPALAARRARCAQARDRLRPRRHRGAAADADEDDGDPLAPVAGWRLGALLRDGTGCPPSPTPTGKVDQAFDYDLAHRAASAALLSAPLPTADLPSCGPVDVDAPVVIQVICNLRSASCGDQLLRARKVAIDYFPSVRVVYRPWVDLDLETAGLELPMAEAVMCSQRLGDGWRFVVKLPGRVRDDVDLARLAAGAGIDPDAFTACADAPPVAARRVIADARAAGVAWAPTVVIGQRAYIGGLTDDRPMHDLIDAELAPGLLGAVTDAAANPADTRGVNTCVEAADD